MERVRENFTDFDFGKSFSCCYIFRPDEIIVHTLLGFRRRRLVKNAARRTKKMRLPRTVSL